MASSLLQSLDKQLEQLFAGWNVYSTGLLVVLLMLLFSPLFYSSEPDVHPFLLARQSAASPVRQPGESAVYRSLETPHGYPLRTGLNVKDEGAPRWTNGRDGDLRDIWREALKDKPARLVKLLGKIAPVHFELKALNKDLKVIGERLRREGGSRVAVYLPNSMEFLLALFACAFYGLTPILITPGQPKDLLKKLLRETEADLLIAPAGTLSPEEVLGKASKLKHIIWVVEETSRHMDFGGDDTTKMSVWHDLVSESKEDTSLPELAEGVPPGIVQVWQGTLLEKYEIVELSQKNIAAAVSSQLTCLPRLHRLAASDTVLSLVPLASSSYALALTLAAMHVRASVALTSSAAPNAQYALAFQNRAVRASILIAAPGTLTGYLAHAAQPAGESLFAKGRNAYRARRLGRGIMPFANASPSSESTTGPRLIYTPFPAPQSVSDATPPLGPADLAELRIRTGARLVHALTVPAVAGAVAQSHPLDYRTDPPTTAGSGSGSRASHFGAPLSCVELRVRRDATVNTAQGQEWVGSLIVGGPAVVGAEGASKNEDGQPEREVGVKVRFAVDGTVALV